MDATKADRLAAQLAPWAVPIMGFCVGVTGAVCVLALRLAWGA